METIDVKDVELVEETPVEENKATAKAEVVKPVEETPSENSEVIHPIYKDEVIHPIYKDENNKVLEKQDVENMATSMTEEANDIIDDTKSEAKKLAEDIKNIVYEGKAAEIIGYSKDTIPKQIKNFSSQDLTKCLEIYDKIATEKDVDILSYLDDDLKEVFIKAAKKEHISPTNTDMIKFFIEFNIRSFGMDVVFEKSEQMLNDRIREESNKLSSPKLFEEYVIESINNTKIKLGNVIAKLKEENTEDDEKTKKAKAKEIDRFEETLNAIEDVGKYKMIREYIDEHSSILNRNKLFKKYKQNVSDIDQSLKKFGMSKFSFGYLVKTANELEIDPVATMCIAAVLSKLNLYELPTRSFVFYFILRMASVGYCESENNYTYAETEEYRDSFKQLCKDLISKIDEHDKEVIASKAKVKGNIMLKKK